MKTFNLFLGSFVVLAALLAPPALLGSVVAGAVGVLLMLTATLPSMSAAAPVPRAPVVQVVKIHEPLRVVELANGVVLFKNVNGQLVTRFFRAR